MILKLFHPRVIARTTIDPLFLPLSCVIAVLAAVLWSSPPRSGASESQSDTVPSRPARVGHLSTPGLRDRPSGNSEAPRPEPAREGASFSDLLLALQSEIGPQSEADLSWLRLSVKWRSWKDSCLARPNAAATALAELRNSTRSVTESYFLVEIVVDSKDGVLRDSLLEWIASSRPEIRTGMLQYLVSRQDYLDASLAAKVRSILEDDSLTGGTADYATLEVYKVLQAYDRGSAQLLLKIALADGEGAAPLRGAARQPEWDARAQSARFLAYGPPGVRMPQLRRFLSEVSPGEYRWWEAIDAASSDPWRHDIEKAVHQLGLAPRGLSTEDPSASLATLSRAVQLLATGQAGAVDPELQNLAGQLYNWTRNTRRPSEVTPEIQEQFKRFTDLLGSAYDRSDAAEIRDLGGWIASAPEVVRSTAVTSLGSRRGSASARDFLISVASSDKSRMVRMAALDGLAFSQFPAFVTPFLEGIASNDPEPAFRSAALSSLSLRYNFTNDTDGKRILYFMIARLSQESDGDARDEVMRFLQQSDAEEARRALEAAGVK